MISKPDIKILLLTTLVFMVLQHPVHAAEFLTGAEVFIGPDEVHNEDVYAFAASVVVEGTINGDLVAAGESIEINGSVSGDLIVAGRVVTVTGAVDDDIRAAASILQFNSLIGGDLITAGDEIRIEAGSVIGQDLVASANSLIASGDVEGNLDLSVYEARLEGTVLGNVDANVEERLTLGPESRIAGELTYTSVNDATVQPGAEVLGAVTKQPPMTEIFGVEYVVTTMIQVVQKIISQARWFIGTVLFGVILIWLFPKTMRSVSETLSVSPWKSLCTGLIVLLLFPIALLILMIIVLSIVGSSAFPIMAVSAMVFSSLLLLAKPAIAITIGSYIARHVIKREEHSLTKALLLGAATLTIIGFIPFVDSIVSWLTLLLGLGMWLLFIYRQYRSTL